LPSSSNDPVITQTDEDDEDDEFNESLEDYGSEVDESLDEDIDLNKFKLLPENVRHALYLRR
jgi:hypothetical protein